MSDQPHPFNASSPELDEIPVEELIRVTREFTRRITNQDRQRLAMDLRDSGHQRSIQVSAPLALQQFFSGEIDLDTELARRFANAPLLSHCRFVPPPGEPVRRQASGIFASQDDAVVLTIDTHLTAESEVALELTITLFGTLALRFTLSPLVLTDRRRWIDLMRRDSGIAFLWTRERWEQPYIVFVVRENFARLYAFSPQGYEAAVRLTPDMVTALLDWLETLWFPETAGLREIRAHPAPRPAAQTRPAAPQWEQRSTQVERPAPPEEAWDDDSADAGGEELSATDLEW
jgi:hypothetical protein